MTINHTFLYISLSKFRAVHAFYLTALKPLGYRELIRASDTYIGIGSDYPYLFLKGVPDEDLGRVRGHIAVQAQSNDQVTSFHKAATSPSAGGTDNGTPGIRTAMSRQPYFAAFVLDPEGNNLEAVCVPMNKS